jgi:3-deoxy-D-manno-octulosonic acid kinase
MRDRAAPPGFVQFAAGSAEVTCAAHVEGPVREMLAEGTLYDYARRHPLARELTGRRAVYAVPLPGDVERVVVRRNHHGGLFGSLRADLFLPPTRAPHELQTSERLRAEGVPTPAILSYAVYTAPGGFRRADVMTREVACATDLSNPLSSTNPDTRVRALDAAACLIRALSHTGARHHDLNIKNILLEDSEYLVPRALVLDVDRVTFARGGADVLEQNLARLLRSARKWQSSRGACVTLAELDNFAALVRRESR